ncbi:hypothetical protein [Pedobacter zeae]|uniref:Uncharacterized protein n=1 Tax=Pedobacter zeae TaxID=1737356 RepID=A0A7W6KAS1_9SPHI|nr:hypothetical protein [Pedobacter zeae]MBB4108343.1 hypothetical protein [Pedobacter zeae]GGG93413.1 hypothetical protein GCM10007422_03300 [Pedobacter zeae]
MAQNTTNRQKLIERIIGVVKGEVFPPKPICILWDEDPESEENIYILNNRQVSYEHWKKFK